MSITLAFILVASLLLPGSALAAHFGDLVNGMILLDVESRGEAWYVYPETQERYYLGRPVDAFEMMRELSLGITDENLSKIPVAGSDEQGDLDLRERLAGTILLQVESRGEAWYVYPKTLERHYLGRPEDAFALMTELGLGITSTNLAHIPIATESLEPPLNEDSSYRELTMVTDEGSFVVHLITLRRDRFDMMTDTAEPEDCDKDCDALSLSEYVSRHDAFAAIHGSYFCPPDYEACSNVINTFLPPVYKTAEEQMIQEDSLNYFQRPFIVQSDDESLFYFHRAPDFGKSVLEFEETYHQTMQAGIGNWPSLVEEGESVVHSEPSESSFLVNGTRGGIGWNDEVIYLAVAKNATVPNLAAIFVAIGADYALNLDGGGSAALYYDGAYQVGPGRDLPNAILFKKR